MKNVFMLWAIVITLISFSSCKEKNEAVHTTDEVNEVEKINDDHEANEAPLDQTQDIEVVTSNTGVPKFDDPQLQSYMDEYDAFFEDYKKAMASQDFSAIQNMATKGEALAEKAQSFTGMSESDAKKLAEYMQEKSEEIQKISMEAAGQ